MRKNYVKDAARIRQALQIYEQTASLPGIRDSQFRETLIEQIIDSEQRVRYFELLRNRDLDPACIDPSDPGFDPLKASLVHNARGDFDEAVWLVFLFVHFGKHPVAGWRYIRDIYGRLGSNEHWTWERTSSDPTMFRFWLHDHQDDLLSQPGPRGFGNHRKYESLNAWGRTGTGEAVESYITWVLDAGDNHEERFAESLKQAPSIAFDELYRSLRAVTRFGRVARFDYLVTLMKLGLLPVEPPHSYIQNATGPLCGARLLLREDGETGTPSELEQELQALSEQTGITPDVLEDAVCNWQKSPGKYIRFSG